MKIQRIFSFLVLLLMLAAGSCSPALPGTAPNATTLLNATQTACEVQKFEATVLQGKNNGLALQGTLVLQADATGALKTQLKTQDGKEINGGGQIIGHAINLYFNLGQGQYIFGTGTLENDFRSCTGTLGGTFSGPDQKDLGGWGCSCCPCYIRTISPTIGSLINPQLETGGATNPVSMKFQGELSSFIPPSSALYAPGP